MSNYNLAVRGGRKGFRTDVVYDVNVAVLIHYSGKYKSRVAAFKRFGLLNLGNYKIHVTIMASPGDGGYVEEICAGWPAGVDVSLVEMSSNLPVPKINGYYLWLKDCGLKARWEIRVDDDSITDVGTTLAHMDERYGDNPVHLLTWPMEEEGGGAPFTRFLRENGIEVPTFVHEYESSLTSGEGLREIFSSPEAVEFLKKTGKVIPAPGDRSLTFCAHISGVPVGNNTLFTKDFLPERLSILPNQTLAHIHYVPWSNLEFVQALEAYLAIESSSAVTADIVDELQAFPIQYRPCLKKTEAILRLTQEGYVTGSPHSGQRAWKLRKGQLWLLHEQGYSTVIFRWAVRCSGRLWLFGPNLWNGDMMCLSTCE